MAFIKETERKSLIKKINQSYGLKKFLLLIEIIALIGFIVITFLSAMKVEKDQNSPWAWFDSNDKLTGLGIGMIVWAAIIAVLGIISVILVFTIRSPKSVIKTNKKLESSALSGKRVYKTQTAGEVMRSRTTIKKKEK